MRRNAGSIPFDQLTPVEKLQRLENISGLEFLPVQVYPFSQPDVDAHHDFSSVVREHIASLSVMQHQEASRSNRIWTGCVARLVREDMERIELLRNASTDPLKVAKVTAPDIKALQVVRLQYLRLLPLTFRINELPRELLVYVLRLSVLVSHAPSERLARAVCLTHVCRLWRFVAIADVRLWRPVCFRNPAKIDRDFTLMERAGLTGLHIQIYDDKAAPMSKDAMKALITRVLQRVDGIRTLDVRTYTRDTMDVLLDSLCRVNPQSLESLELHCLAVVQRKDQASFSSARPLFGSSIPPLFKHFHLAGITIDWNINLLSRLTTLNLRFLNPKAAPPIATFRAILQNANHLEKLVLVGAGPVLTPNTPNHLDLPPVVLPNVKILEIGSYGDGYIEFLLSHLTIPNVLDLTLVSPFSSTTFSSLSLLSPMPFVQILTLLNQNGQAPLALDTAPSMSKWLRNMPALTFLRLINPPRVVYDLLLLDQNGNTFNLKEKSPKPLVLDRLIYLDWRGAVADFPQLHHFLASRKSFGRPIHRLWIPARVVVYLTTIAVVRIAEGLAEDGVGMVSGCVRTQEENMLCSDVYTP